VLVQLPLPVHRGHVIARLTDGAQRAAIFSRVSHRRVRKVERRSCGRDQAYARGKKVCRRRPPMPRAAQREQRRIRGLRHRQ
jgi:hypothetical protein